MTTNPAGDVMGLLVLVAVGCACGRTALAILPQDGSPETEASGTCGHACVPGIACQAGTCQQYRCKGALRFKALALTSTADEGGAPYRPAMGDFDGDGILDLVGVPGAKASMSLLYGAGDGTFPTYHIIDSALVTDWQALAADVDGDGRLDLASISRGQSGVTVRRGSGNRDAPFVETTGYPTRTGPSSVLLADLDADGRLDLVAGAGQAIEYWRGQDRGRFEHRATFDSPDPSFSGPYSGPSVLLAPDWNGDGLLDLAFGGGNLHLRLGHGDGDFDPELTCALPAAGCLGDLDHDHRLDLVNGTGLLFGLDGCHARQIVPVPDWSQQSLRGVALADLDGDDNLDIVADSDAKLTVRVGDGLGGFAHVLSLPGTDTKGTSDSAFLIGDLDRDGKLDIVLTRSDGWRVFLNTCP